MAKTIINITIKSLTLQLGNTRPSEALLALIARTRAAHEQEAEHEVELDESAADANAPMDTDPAAPVPQLNDANVLAFLRSDPRYTKRTFESLAKHFGVSLDGGEGIYHKVLEDMLDIMNVNGQVKNRRRRRDGAALFEAVAGAQPTTVSVATPEGEATTAQVQTAQDVAPELTDDNVLAFLRSDSRYTKRTVTSFQEHFAGNTPYEVLEVLRDMNDQGSISQRNRRSDGAVLYQAA